ncbi:MAG: C25 family cysteine peptidase [Thermoplasmatota archaeon]
MHLTRPIITRAATLIVLVLLIGALPLPLLKGSSTSDWRSGPVEKMRGEPSAEPYPLGLDIPEQDPEYVILCPEQFKEEVRPLAVHRTISGLPSRIYTIDSIVENYTGVDDQQKVHDFLRDLHGTYSSFKWLLIVADAEHLMPRKLWHYAENWGQPFGNYYYSDVYYSGLDSDWDDDGDERFGELTSGGNVEGDLDWDVYVGRIPASTEEHARNYVNKLIRYERDPPVGSWMKRFCNWGSLMEPPNRDFDPYRYVDHRSNAYKVCKRIEGNLPEHLDVNPLYDYPQLEGGNYTPSDGRDTLNRANMLSAINNGASMLNFAGQARYEGYALNDYGPPTGSGSNWAWNEPLRYSDHSLFTNQDMMPFMYASTCNSSMFFDMSPWYNDKSLETWLTSASGGIIGLISSTGVSARGEEEGRSWGNWYLDEEFWKLFFDHGVTRPGNALYVLKEIYEDKWFSPTMNVKETVLGMIYSYILLGDPYVDIYSDVAERFASEADMGIDLYTGDRLTRFRVTDRDGDPVARPLVTIYDQDRYIVVRGNNEGWVNSSLDLGSSEEVNLTICAHNMVPSYMKVDVGPAISDITFGRSDLLLTPQDPTPGEEVRFSLDVHNIGGMDGEMVQVSVIYEGGSGDPTYYYRNFEIGTLPVGATTTVHWNWTVRFGEHRFVIEAISSSKDLDPFNQQLEIDFDNPGPDLQFFPGTGLIRPDSILAPDTSASVDVDILNNGSAPSMIDLQLYMGDPEEEGVPLSDPLAVGPVPAGGWWNVSIPLTTPSSTCIIYILMDPGGKIPSNMTSGPFKTLLEINHPPEWKSAPSMEILEDTRNAWVRIDDKVSDVDNTSHGLDFTLDPIAPIEAWISDSGNETYLNCIPGPDLSGKFRVRLTVSDGISSSSINATINILEVNDPPTFPEAVEGVLEITTMEDALLELHIKASDIDDDNITFSISNAPFDIERTTGRIEWTPLQEDVGSNSFNITAQDDRGGSSQITLIVHVIEVNDPPIVQDIDDLVLNYTETVSFTLQVEDEENDALTFFSNSDMIIIHDNGTVVFNLTSGDVGQHQVRISINDGVNTVYLIFNVTVLDEDLPGDEEDGPEVGSILIAAAIGAAVFLLLLGGMLLFRRTEVDSRVAGELDDADRMFREDMDIEE